MLNLLSFKKELARKVKSGGVMNYTMNPLSDAMRVSESPTIRCRNMLTYQPW